MSGGSTQSTTSSSTVPPQFLQAYDATVNRATNVAKTPYQAYSQPLVAGFSGQQTQAQNEVSGLQGTYQPELNAAQGNISASTTPLWNETMQTGVPSNAGTAGYTPDFLASSPGVNASTISQYENPFQSQVTNATEAQMANTDAQQQAQLAGNAGSAGAFGGDRQGVAAGILGGQEALANNATLANLNTTNYDTALQTAEQQQGTGIAANEASTQVGNSEFNTQQQNQLGANEANAWLNSQAGYGEANLAQEGQNLGLGDASALASSGLTQQQQDQAGLNTAYEQWQAQQAFPYQQTGWLANITEGIGSNVGGSSTTSTSQSNRGGRIARATGGGIVGYDGGGSILSDIPDVATSYIPQGSSSGSGGGRGIPTANAPPMQQSPWANPATDIGAASGAMGLYNNLGGGSLFGSTTAAADPIASGIAAGNTMTLPAVDIGSGIESATTPVSIGATSPGIFANVGDTVATGASDVAGAVGDGLSAVGSGLGALGDAAVGAIGSGLGWVGDALASLFLKSGGRVEEEPQHHAHGGIVIPFPQDRARKAGGGIAGNVGNAGVMPYSEAPPVPLQATGTTGMQPMAYMSSATPSPSGAMSAGTGTGALGGIAAPMFRRGGGIAPRHYDDGGATPVANDDDWGGAAGTPDSSATWNAPAQGSSVSVNQPPPRSFTPEKPNLWMPALAGIAGAVLGRHTNEGRNLAEGVLSGLNTYNGEDQRYQQGQEKAVSLDQEAKRLADDADFHRGQLAHESSQLNETTRHNQADESTAAANASSEAQYRQVSGAADTTRAGADVARVGVEAAGEKSLEHWRDTQGGAATPVGTDANGKMVFASKYGPGMTDETGQPYTGPVNAMPSVIARTGVQTRGQDLQHQDRLAGMSQKDQEVRATLLQRGQHDIVAGADSIIGNGKAATYQDAVNQAQAAHAQIAPAQQAQQQPNAGAGIPHLTDLSQAANLPPGAQFVDPNGILRHVPQAPTSP